MRNCVFCVARADSKEHVFAKRLVKRMKRIDFEVETGHWTYGECPISRPAHRLNTFMVGKTCIACNNGWMNPWEAWFEENLGLLIEPTWPPPADTIIASFRDGIVPCAKSSPKATEGMPMSESTTICWSPIAREEALLNKEPPCARIGVRGRGIILLTTDDPMTLRKVYAGAFHSRPCLCS